MILKIDNKDMIAQLSEYFTFLPKIIIIIIMPINVSCHSCAYFGTLQIENDSETKLFRHYQ